MTDNPIAALEQPFAVFQNGAASSAELRGAAEQARSAVSAIEAENERSLQREATVLAGMASAGIQPTLKALETLYDESEQRALLRKVGTHLAAAIDRRARDAAKAETDRDEKRRPFLDQTRRAQDIAKRIADYPTLAERIMILLRTDIVIARLGESVYSRTPRPQGSHVGYRLTFTVPRTIATEGTLKATKLPGFWPPKWSDYSLIERNDYEFEEDAGIVGPLLELCQNHDQRRIVLSEDQVGAAVARAQAVLIAEFNKTIAAIADLMRLDAGIAAPERDVRYPDGQAIYDPKMFPENWRVGMMSRSITLPAIGSSAMAAE